MILGVLISVQSQTGGTLVTGHCFVTVLTSNPVPQLQTKLFPGVTTEDEDAEAGSGAMIDLISGNIVPTATPPANIDVLITFRREVAIGF